MILWKLDMDQKMIIKGEKCCDWKCLIKLVKLRRKIGDIVPKSEFAYGYANYNLEGTRI